MKKLFVFAMVATVLTIFNGCQKEEQVLIDEKPQAVVSNPMFEGLNDIAFSVEDNCLAFESEKEFQKCIDFLAQLGDENFPLFEKEIGFDSYRKVFEDDEVKSEVFVDELYQTLLNPEMEIVVGDYLFREVPEKEITIANVYKPYSNCLLKSNVIKDSKTIFSWNDCAFDIIAGNEVSYLKRGCTSDREKYKDWHIESNNYYGTSSPDDNGAYKIDLKAKLCFQKTAIFKSLIAKIKPEKWLYHNMPADRWFKIKVKMESIGNIKVDFNKKDDIDEKLDRSNILDGRNEVFFDDDTSKLTYRPFNTTKRVNSYSATVNFSWEVNQYPSAPQYYGQKESKVLSISCY